MRHLNRLTLNSRSVTLVSFASVAVLLAASCGHTKKTIEALKAQEQANSSTTDSGTTDSGTTDSGTTDSGTTSGPDPYAEVLGPDDFCEPPVVAGAEKFSCDVVASQQFDETNMRGYCVPKNVAADVNEAINLMSPAEEATQMLGIPVGGKNWRDIERSPDVDVPGYGTIRGYRYRDAGRGVNLDAGQDNRPDDKKNYATAFPAASLRAASWDLDLERRIATAIGDETAASKNNMNLGPCMNIVRHPYWGRTQETYGEDSYAIGRFATAYSVGVQEFVVGCAKHFAANNIEKERSKQNAEMTEQTLREVYSRHFEMVTQDGALGCVMASYNLVNGKKATQSEHLLREVLKGPVEEGGMGYQGLVITDWWAMPGDQVTDGLTAATAEAVTNEAVIAGTDIEVPWQMHYSEATLTSNTVNKALVEDSVRRVLTQKFLFRTATDEDAWAKKRPTTKLVGGSLEPNPAHEDLTVEAVVKSAVLLDNGEEGAPVLPLKDVASVAVIGQEQYFEQILSSVPPICGYSEDTAQGSETVKKNCTFKHAEDAALGDRGSSRVNADPKRSIGPFAGIKEIAGSNVNVTKGTTAADAEAAAAVVVIVGYTPGDEGEEYYIASGGDRSSLNLPAGQNELVTSVLDLGKPTIIIIQSGSMVNLPWLDHPTNQNQATIWAGYPGMRGGLAYGKLLFGQENFSGKMPMAWVTEDLLPAFKGDSNGITVMDYFFGYRLFDKLKYVDNEDISLVYPFGHGLSYSTFEYSNPVVPCETVSKEAVFKVTVDVKNTSTVDGDEVVFLFIKPPAKPEGVTGERPWKELKSFDRVSVAAGMTAVAELPVRVRDLRRWEGGEEGNWVIDSGEYTILVGKDADDAESAAIMGKVTIN